MLKVMRNIQAANIIRKQAWDRKTRWTWNGPEEELQVEAGRFKQLDSANEDSHSVDRFAAVRWNRASGSQGKQSSKAQDSLLKSRQVVLKSSQVNKTNDINMLIVNNSLPPICRSRVCTVSGAKSCVSSQHALEIAKKEGVSSNGARSVRTLICRQKERAQFTSKADVICKSLAPFRAKCTQDSQIPPSRKVEKKKAWMKPSVMKPKKNLSSTGSGMIANRNKDSESECKTIQLSQPLSNSAFETDTQILHRERNTGIEDEEEVYYTTKMIAEWILRVNASLFSPFNDDLNKTLKEEDVDTVKIIYGQD